MTTTLMLLCLQVPAADGLELTNWPADHFFPEGRLAMPVRVRAGDGEDLVLSATLETYSPNRPGQVLARRDVRVERRPADVELGFDPPAQPGPYEFEIVLRDGERTFARRRGMLMYRPDDWTLPDLEPADFDAFWTETLRELRRRPLDPELRDGPSPGLPAVFREVAFNGLGERRVRGFLGRPAPDGGRKAPAYLWLPGGGYSAAPVDASLVGRGFVVLSLSIHDAPFEDGRQHPESYQTGAGAKYMEQGLAHRDTYFYRHAYAACARAIDFLRSLPDVDPARIVVAGGSQGGSLALAAAGLVQDVALVLCDSPGRSRWDLLSTVYRANASFRPPPGMTPEEMFSRTLAYFDVSHFARRVRGPIVFSTPLCDEINPAPLQLVAYANLPAGIDKRRVIDLWGGHLAVPAARAVEQEALRIYVGR